MNRLLLLLLISCSYSCHAQQINSATGNIERPATDTIEAFNGEFDVYTNGLIYSPHTVKQLTHIVDSLNLKFKRCDLTRPFVSLRQGIAYHVRIDKKMAKQAAKDMAAGMSVEDIIAKYQPSEKKDSLYVVIHQYERGKETVFEFTGLTFKSYSDIEIYKPGKTDYNKLSLANKWIADEPLDDMSLDAFYFKEEPVMAAIPEKYGRMILYSECVVDTTTDIYTGPKNYDYFGNQSPKFEKHYKKTKLYAFYNYLEKRTDKWEPDAIDSTRKVYVRNVLSKEDEFRKRLQEAVEEINNGKIGSEDNIEYYVANYHSKKLALEMKRKRRVVGGCSMDQSPRIHAQEIAMLSAEAVNWETFLRAHLNIMNDRFDRASDASWARQSRQTYIKELETLNLDVNDLLIGISLRTGNAAAKHYYGNISRLGRAFAETSNKELLVNTLTAAIADNKLDNYNRVLMFYLLNHYSYNLKEKEERTAAYQLLVQAKQTLPSYIAAGIHIQEQNFK